MSMFMTVNEEVQELSNTNKTAEDVEYYVTKMQDSGSRVEVSKFQNRRPLGMTLPDGNIIEVSCGHLVGRLHRDRFYCPGIHRECIEVDGEFVTPKKFSVLGDKQRLKDWKNAIRINNRQIRKFIDSGELTFWNHDSLCTGRCIARSPAIRPVGMPVTIDSEKKDSYRFETLTTTVTSSPDVPSQVSLVIPEEIGGACGESGDWDQNLDVKPDVEQLQAQMLAATKLRPIVTHPQSLVSNITTLTTSSKSSSYSYPVSSSSPSFVSNTAFEEGTDEDDRMLWKGIVELGLIDEFFREIKAALDAFKNDMIRRYVPLDASKKISVIVKELGLMSKLRYKLGAHKTEMDRQRQKLDREMEDLQRKVKEYVQKKAILKRKSECFDQLIDITASKKDETPEEQIPTPVKLENYKETGPTPRIIFPSQLVMSSSDSVSVTLADSVTTSESAEKVVFLKNTENYDDQSESTDFESATMVNEQNSSNDSESNEEISTPKGDNCNIDNVDSTTDEHFVTTDIEQSSRMEVDSENQNSNSTVENGDSEDFTKIRLSKRRKLTKNLD